MSRKPSAIKPAAKWKVPLLVLLSFQMNLKNQTFHGADPNLQIHNDWIPRPQERKAFWFVCTLWLRTSSRVISSTNAHIQANESRHHLIECTVCTVCWFELQMVYVCGRGAECEATKRRMATSHLLSVRVPLQKPGKRRSLCNCCAVRISTQSTTHIKNPFHHCSWKKKDSWSRLVVLPTREHFQSDTFKNQDCRPWPVVYWRIWTSPLLKHLGNKDNLKGKSFERHKIAGRLTSSVRKGKNQDKNSLIVSMYVPGLTKETGKVRPAKHKTPAHSTKTQ